MHTRLKLIALAAAAALSASVNAQSLNPEATPLAAQSFATGQETAGALDYAVSRDTIVGVQWGRVLASTSFLGAVPGDAVGSNNAPTRSVGVWASHRLSETWQLGAQYSVALAPGDGSTAASSVAFGFVGHDTFVENDRLSLTLSSPMAVAAAGAHIGMPVTIADHGEAALALRRSELSADRPAARATVDYRVKLSRGTTVNWIVDLNRRSAYVPGDSDSRVGFILRKKF